MAGMDFENIQNENAIEIPSMKTSMPTTSGPHQSKGFSASTLEDVTNKMCESAIYGFDKKKLDLFENNPKTRLVAADSDAASKLVDSSTDKPASLVDTHGHESSEEQLDVNVSASDDDENVFAFASEEESADDFTYESTSPYDDKRSHVQIHQDFITGDESNSFASESAGNLEHKNEETKFDLDENTRACIVTVNESVSSVTPHKQPLGALPLPNDGENNFDSPDSSDADTATQNESNAMASAMVEVTHAAAAMPDTTNTAVIDVSTTPNTKTVRCAFVFIRIINIIYVRTKVQVCFSAHNNLSTTHRLPSPSFRWSRL